MMSKSLSLLLIALLTLNYRCDGASEDAKRRLREEEIIPDVLQTLSDDVELLGVSYSSETRAELGNVLTPTQVKDKPTITYEAEKGARYTLAMQDPDAPSRKEPSRREFRHWLIVNIPGNDISKGETVFDYIGSGPPKVR
jgi:phosphatidylethanolamine-binding protein (PEBP) family uncharacterized protein